MRLTLVKDAALEPGSVISNFKRVAPVLKRLGRVTDLRSNRQD